MSKKNKRSTKANYHQLSLEREREAAQKKQVKAEKKQQRDAVRKVAGTSKSIKKSKKGGIRIRKGVTIKGIKVVDSASKKKALQKLQDEKTERQMDVDPPKKRTGVTLKKIKKAPRPAKKDGPTPME